MNLSDIQDLVERAKHRGMNPIERLDAMGLILTDDRRDNLVREVCQLLAEMIDVAPLKMVLPQDLRATATSPLDVKRGIAEYIRRSFSEDSVK